MTQVLKTLILFSFLLFIWVFVSQRFDIPNKVRAIEASSNIYTQTTQKYIDFVKNKDFDYVDYFKKKNNEMGAMGVACSTLIAAYKISGDPVMKTKALQIGDYLVANKDLNQNGKVGWSISTVMDPFGDNTPNPINTEYMFQTGRVINCLAELDEISSNQTYIDTAKQALADSWSIGNYPSDCTNCFYYWYSYHPNDKNRYVRNTNLEMGQALAYVYKATKMEKYKNRAIQVLNAEINEINKNNYGYFGVRDQGYIANPQYESKRSENHYPGHALYLYDMTRLLDIKDKDAYIIDYLNKWRDCWGRSMDFCPTENLNCAGAWSGDIEKCTNTYTFYYCYVRNVSTDMDNACKHEINDVNNVPANLSFFQYWSVLRGFKEVFDPVLLPGDLDNNGKVDILDYNILITDFGKTGSPGWIRSDIIEDGKVDIFDYNILVANFGKTL